MKKFSSFPKSESLCQAYLNAPRFFPPLVQKMDTKSALLWNTQLIIPVDIPKMSSLDRKTTTQSIGCSSRCLLNRSLLEGKSHAALETRNVHCPPKATPPIVHMTCSLDCSRSPLSFGLVATKTSPYLAFKQTDTLFLVFRSKAEFQRVCHQQERSDSLSWNRGFFLRSRSLLFASQFCVNNRLQVLDIFFGLSFSGNTLSVETLILHLPQFVVREQVYFY